MIANTNLTGQYTLNVLNESDLDPDPIRQFGAWFDAAVSANAPEPSAMTLATTTLGGIPSARIVLLKAYDALGFTFFTNCESPKGHQLSENPRAALVLFWPTLQRQVRIVGNVSSTTRAEAEAYFHTRPLGSQIGAWASKQSEVLATREELEARARQFAAEFENKEIPMPDYWGGFRVAPVVIEFWQGRADRLHDRFRYSRRTGSSWLIERLAP